jgi:hypothetical protein
MNTIDTYRFDGRTKEQFIRDTKEGHRRQALVVVGFAKYYEMKTGEQAIIEDNGCNNSGEYLEAHQVSADADMKVNGHLVEVKTQFTETFTDELWFKKDHIDKLIRKGSHLIFAYGDFRQNKILFSLIMNDELEELVKDAEIEYPAKYDYRKAVYVISPKQLRWDDLPVA